MSLKMSRELLFEDEKKERDSLPYAHLHKFPEELTEDHLRFQVSLGSVFGLAIDDKAMHERCSDILEEVGRICREPWSWYSADETITSMVPMSSLGSGTNIRDNHNLVEAATDLHKILYINFASRDDAMLVRMTIEDMRSVKCADSGALPT